MVNAISLDGICTLIAQTYQGDDIGNDIPTETSTDIFCMELPTSRREIGSASSEYLKPSATLIVETESYNGEEKAVLNNLTFSIYRVYKRFDGYTELYLGTKIGVTNG